MGNLIMNNQRDEEEDSSADSAEDVDIHNEIHLIQVNRRKISENRMEVDAVGGVDLTAPRATRLQFDQIDLKHVEAAERSLDEGDKVAMIYLLYDTTPHIVLQNMLLLCNGNSRQFLVEWAKNEQSNVAWREKFIEALCVIQHYKLIKSFGFEKLKLKQYFNPNEKYYVKQLNDLKKYFYRLFENLSAEEEADLLNEIHMLTAERYKYLEMYIAHLEIQKIGMTEIAGYFKVIGKDVEFNDIMRLAGCPKYDILSKLGENLNPTNNTARRGLNVDQSAANMSSRLSIAGSEYSDIVSQNSGQNDRYYINPDSPGILIIIENEHFYTDPEASCTLDKPQMNPRTGTVHDSARLQRLFESFGYTVVHESNRTDAEIKRIIQEHARRFDASVASSFFVCFLSHGEEGRIMGSNSIPVAIDEVKRWLVQAPSLVGVPKVLIMQSCQGSATQKLSDHGDAVETDGGGATGPDPVPATADIFELWSTVRGYASFRDTNKGTWLIQTLCNVIERNPRREFNEICTIVARQVTERTCTIDNAKCKMVCERRSTFLKSFYFPPIIS